jgi:hypothetical protein
MELAITITDWILFLSIIASFAISLKHREKKDLLPIQLYIIVSLIVNAILKFIEISSTFKQNEKVESALINIYSILEITILYYFFLKRIRRIGFRISLIMFYLFYLFTCITLWTIRSEGIFLYAPNLFGIEGLLLTIPCFFYIFEIVKSDKYVDLKFSANFIVTCGILFYFGITIPAYFSWYNLYCMDPRFDKIVIISNYIFYTLLFISFMKAYLCIIPKRQH